MSENNRLCNVCGNKHAGVVICKIPTFHTGGIVSEEDRKKLSNLSQRWSCVIVVGDDN